MSRKPLTVVVLSALATFAVTLTGEYLRWDDRMHILFNPWLVNHALDLIWTKPYYNLFVPVTYTVWSGVYALTDQAWAFHLLNIMLHALNSALAYKICSRFATSRPALFAALIFAVHPLQVETVAWISGGRDLLAATFTFSAMLAYLNRPRWLSVILFGLALLSKPTVAPAPIAFALLIWWRDQKIPWALTAWAGLAVLAGYATQQIQLSDAQMLAPTTPLDRMLVAGDALGFYLSKFLLPIGLTADYGRTPAVLLAHSLYRYTLPVLALVTALVVRGRARVFVLWSLLLLAPVLGLIPFQAQNDSTVADRYMYLSMLGLALFVAPRIAGLRIAPALIAGLAALSVVRAHAWTTNARFFNDIHRKNPDSFMANVSLGVENLLREDLGAAEHYLARARELRPMNAVTATNLGQVYWNQKRPDRILQELEPLLASGEFLSRNKNETGGLSALHRVVARALWDTGKWDAANDHYCRFYKLDPENKNGIEEIREFLKEKAKRGLPVDGCGG
ncbi:MAG TPA: glycosyltransferase family 39 protein [Bdellovibrionales bacterium]|nr:glycosyltransferase family 39 protein [Bdellovibrionales bacterium]